MYQALYRKYRPQTLEDMVGQEHIVALLKGALIQSRISHAYVFNGPRGTGKTSAAKIFAKLVNCSNQENGEACNTCPSCLLAREGKHPDIYEIDAASNNGVAEIRELREAVKYLPMEGKYKVYIIDEVHMLTVGAFNALLKTLEEPPEHIIFILATTEPHKIPETILSRVLRFDFKQVSEYDIHKRLTYICVSEHIEYEDAALFEIARRADGGMRDAISMLDHVLSTQGDVTLEKVTALLGIVSKDIFDALFKAMQAGEVQQVMQLYRNLVAEGKNIRRLLLDFMYYLREDLYQTKETGDALFSRVHVIECLNERQSQLRFMNEPVHFIEVALLAATQKIVMNTVHTDGIMQQDKDEKITRDSFETRPKEKVIDHVEVQVREKRHEEPQRQDDVVEEDEIIDTPFEEEIFQNQALALSEDLEEQIVQYYHRSDVTNILSQATKEDKEKATNAFMHIQDELRKINKRSFLVLLETCDVVAASSDGVVIITEADTFIDMLLSKKEELASYFKEYTGNETNIIVLSKDVWKSERTSYVSTMKSKEEKKPPEHITVAQELFGEHHIEVHEDTTKA